MATLASLADVKRVLHRDANDTSIDDDLSGALEAANALIKRYLKQDHSQTAASTYTVYDRPEDSLVAVPVQGSTITQVRLYRTASATPYVAQPLIDYEVHHDGVQPPAAFGVGALATGGTFAAGTYYWVVTAGNGQGETNASIEISAVIALNGSASLSWTLYGGETFIKVYRGTASGAETLVTTLNAVNGVVAAAYTDTGTAPGTATPPPLNSTSIVPARNIRLHPTYFDVPFEGATAAHLPDNWSRIEIDYTPPPAVPAPVRDGCALTAAAIYVRGPLTASAFTSEHLGDYSYQQRPLKGAGGGANEAIPEVAKALLRPYKRRGSMTT